MNIYQFEFNKTGKDDLVNKHKGLEDWPIVYLIDGDKELYIGETQNIFNRFEQHLNNPARKDLKNINVIYDNEFNKSAILDIEQNLIQLCGADGKYKLQNLNGGQSYKHDYYDRKRYLDKIDDIWEELKKRGIVNTDINEIRNSDLFKYSPYNTLTTEQSDASNKIIKDLIKKLENNIDGTAIINGGAGTGKTIVLINLMYKLINATKFNISKKNNGNSDEDDDENDYYSLFLLIQNFVKNFNLNKPLKIAYICPMTSLRKTIKKVFSLTKNGLESKLVIGPFGIFNDCKDKKILDENGNVKDEYKYDILLVDEAHRLSRRKNISCMGAFDEHCKALGLDKDKATQLDMIVKMSKYRILVYDENQTVKGSDLTDDQFNNALKNSKVLKVSLHTQMRCFGGVEYTEYINNIFDCTQKEFLMMTNNYDFKLFDKVDDMVNQIKILDKKYGLCRNASGYAWEWVSKPYTKLGYKYIMDNGYADIHIDGHDYVWNMTNQEFIISKNAINEIGCIHTLQGYDLNYVGVILGREIDYDPINNRIVIDQTKFFDKNVKNGTTDLKLKDYILNSYKVIMSRGIKGCYVYAYNKNLREYLKRFILLWTKD